MSSIVTAVFKATIGLIVNKGRDTVAEKLKDGDVTDQKFRGLIVREINDIKSKLDGLARKDLKASISFFKEGIELLLYEVFEKARPRRELEHGTVTAETVAAAACAETVSLAKGMRKLWLTDLDESTERALAIAKGRFTDARRKATEAFNNEALELSDRVLAMQYRVMATILEAVDNPEDALTACRVCIEELHSLSAVKNCFTVELKKGFRAWIGKDERRALIFATYRVNRAIYDVTLMVCGFGSKQLSAYNWPCIDSGKEKIDPLRDGRVARVLQTQGMQHRCITPWSFGQAGEEEHKLKWPRSIATKTDGNFIIADNGDKTVKVFDCRGNFVDMFYPQTDPDTKFVQVLHVATDVMSNTYVLVKVEKTGTEEYPYEVLVYSQTADLLHKFPLRVRGSCQGLTVSNNNVVVSSWTVIQVYKNNGTYVRSFGQGILEFAIDITAGPNGQLMVLDVIQSCIHVFTEDGQHRNTFEINTEGEEYHRVACPPTGEHVVVAVNDEFTRSTWVVIINKDGEWERTIQLGETVCCRAITVSMDGRIAVAFVYEHGNGKVLVL